MALGERTRAGARTRAGGRRPVASVICVALLASLLSVVPWQSSVAAADPVPPRTYTTSLDFSAGESINVVDVVPDQLQLDDTTRTFGFIWVALSNRGTTAKVDTATGEVLGEYRTAPVGRDRDPSRTTVDQDGNVWVGNRGEANGGRGSVVHLGLEENGQCEDRNGNGQIDTSTGLGDVRDWPNAGGADHGGGVTVAEDECIINYVRTAGTAIRHVSVTPDNHVWVGGPRTDRGKLELLDSDGTSLRVIDMALPADTGEAGRVTCCYGGLVDPDGIVWSATAGNRVVRIDPSFPNGHPDLVQLVPVRFSYGLGIDVDRNIWISNWTANGVDKVAPSGAHLGRFPTTSGSGDRGVVGGPDGDVWVANSSRDRVTRFGPDGTIEAIVPVGNQPTGVAVDRDGKVWTTNLSSDDLSRIDPATNTVDLTVDLRIPGQTRPLPYNYSDMTGSTLTGRPDRGTWRVVHDAGEADATWPELGWTADVPGDASLRVFVASSDDGVTFGPSVEAVAGEAPPVGSGRYLRVEVRFERASSGETPVLHDLSIGATNRPPVADAGDDQEVVEGGVVTLDGSGSSDPDDDELRYEWRLLGASGPPVNLSSATSPSASFAAPDDGTYRFELTVSDGRETSTDTVTVRVVNAAPTAEGRLDAAASGGVSLLSASFTDPGYFDTHTATVDWGDGTPGEEVPVAAQGTGWGTVVASHVYAEPGSYTATLTLRDDDGGEAVVVVDEATVVAPTAIWAGSTDAANGLWVSGAHTVVDGATHSNADLRANGAQKTFTGPTTYVRKLTVNGNHTFDPPATRTDVQGPPVPFTIADYQPGGRAALAVGDAYHDMSAACAAAPGGQGWRPQAPLEPGLYYAPCDITIAGGSFAAGPVTMAATGEISVSGAADEFFAPYVDGVLFVSGRTGGDGIDIAGAHSRFAGYLLAPTANIDVNGSHHRFRCGLIGDTVRITGGTNQVVASDCAPPEHTSPPPLLVPRLELGLTQTPGEVLPGDTIGDAVTATNTGAVLVVPTVVGAENLGEDPAALTGATVTVEARSAVDGAWAPVPGTVELTARPNPHPGTTYGTGVDPFAGTVLAGGSLATWAVEARTDLTAATAAALVDPATTAAVRVRVELSTEPSTAAVRPLWRFGDDLAPALAGAGASLDDVRVTLIGPDGTVHTFDPATTAELASLAPGATASMAATAAVPLPAPPGPTETAEVYLARLAALDGTRLFAATYGQATGGVGLVLAPQQLASSTRRVPVVAPSLVGAASAPADTDVTYELGLANSGSTSAEAVEATASIDADAATVEGLPTSLTAGGLATGTIAHHIPADHPGGTLAVRSTLRWSDARGTPYGPVRSTFDTTVAGPPAVTATLVDALLVDADGTGQPSPGDTIGYTARVTNTSGNPVTNGSFSLTPDPHSGLVAGSVVASIGTVTVGNGPTDREVGVDLGTLAPLGSADITFAVTIAEPLAAGVSKLTAQGVVRGDLLADVPTDDPAVFGSADATVTPVFRAQAALGATLTARLAVDRDGNGVVSPGDTLAYSATVDQLGNVALDAVGFTLTPDANTNLVDGSVTTSRGTVTGGNAGEPTVAVDVGAVPTFAGTEIAFEVVVDDPFPVGVTTVSAQATVTSTQTGDVASDDPTTDTPGDATVTAVVVGGGTSEPIATGPAVEGCSPEDGAPVTDPTTFTCTLVPRPDTVVEHWNVTLRPVDAPPGSDETIQLGEGTDDTVEVEVDPTVLRNGIWTVVTTTTDDDGGTTVDERSIVVAGQLKLGRYSVTYEDMRVPVGGIPIQVLRTYDTLDRHRSGDFGHGWTMELSNFRVQSNRPLGQGGWEQYGCGGGLIFSSLCYRTSRAHFVSVTWPDGRVETFDFTPRGLNTFFPVGAIPAYTGRSNTTSRLEPAPGDTSVGWRGDGNLYRGGFGEGPVYDPSRFVLVGRDGTRYLLDEEAGLVEATDLRGGTVTVTPEGISSNRGPGIDIERDDEGRIDRILGPSGVEATYAYDDGDLAAVTGIDGRRMDFGYDPGHLLSTMEGGGLLVRRLEHGDDGRVEAITDGAGNRVAVSFDPAARLQTVTSADLRRTTVTTFDEDGDPIEVREIFDGRVLTTTASFSDDGLPLTMTDPAGNRTTWRWDEDSNLTSYEDPTGVVTTFGYDDAGRPVEVRVDGVLEATYTYNEWGDLTESRDGSDAAVRYTYDHRGLLIQQLDGSGRLETYTYGGSGLLERIDTPTGPVTMENDAFGRAVRVTDQSGSVTAYEYDEVGNLLSTTDGNGRTASWTYDELGRLETATDKFDAVTTYGYDGADRLTSVSRRDGTTVTYGYDAAGSLTSIVGPDVALSYSYDPLGRIVSATSADVAVEFTFDDASRVVGQSTVPTAAWDGAPSSVAFAYDRTGRLAGIDDGVSATAYGYDERGRLRAVDDSGSGSFAFGYDDAGNLSRLTRPNGIVEERAYDASGLLTELVTALDGDVVQRFEYGFDASARRDVLVDGAGQHAYGYDRTGQLTSVDRPEGSPLGDEWYDYDANGNRSAWHASARGLTESDGDRLLADEQATYSYDPVGRRSSRTDRSTGERTDYRWNALDQLVALERSDGTTTRFRYDALGRRIEVDHAGEVTRFEYAGGNVRATLDGSNLRTASFTTALGWDSILGATSEAGVSYPLTDAQGTPTALSDAAGQVTDLVEFDSFGNPGELTDQVRPYAWTGLVGDPTGLYHARSRYYDPAVGRFLSEDPLAAANAFAWGDNDPTSGTDPLGAVVIGEYTAIQKRNLYYQTFAREVGSFACSQLVNYVLTYGGGMAGVGKAGEDAVEKFLGANKNNQLHYTKSGQGRIPDFIARNGRFVEVKNTANLYKTRQIRDMIEIAGRAHPGDPLVIITRQNTNVSKRLLNTAGVKIVACLPGG
jgi:RHS repeat-associated protein/uncharacterized repeat protein (TIGR01451 family)